jgi:subtilase family serine protease
MSFSNSRLIACFLVWLTLLFASATSRAQSADPIPQNADFTQSRILPNHHPQWAKPINDIGAVPGNQLLENMTLVLARSPDREQAFEQFLKEQQDPGSTDYHHWLTPEEIGKRFGLSEYDIGTITNWLQSQGLHVSWIAPNRVFIGFSGTARDMGSAFQTEFHYYKVGTKRRLSVSSNPMIPAVLVPVIKAVRGFFSINEQPLHHITVVNSSTPEFNSNGNHFLTPVDFNTIYDVPSSYTGAGITIGIVGRSRTNVADFENFKNLTGSTFPDPTEVIPTSYGGVDPGPAYTSEPTCEYFSLCSSAVSYALDDQGEATLDVLRAGSVAPGAQLLLVVSATTSSNGDGIGPAAQYLVNTSPVPAQVMSISFGACESEAGLSGVDYWNTLFQSAAGEGISVFVSSGDAGASGCDTAFKPPPANPAANSPNYICSSPYATCVGGTEFNDQSSPSSYWNSGNGLGLSSALTYIPEGAWNESSTAQVAASGGGVSVYISTPEWQTGTGIPPVSAGRYTPDIAFSAAAHDGYYACYAAMGGACSSSTAFVSFFGTSAAAPGMAGVAALLDQKRAGNQGNLNPEIYALAASAPLVFHDVTIATSGISSCDVITPSMCNNSISGLSGSSAQAGYTVGTGYDKITGWGSLDVANFIQDYSQSLSAFLIPSISTGAAPLTTTFTARATGTASGTLNYSIWWNCSDTSTSVSEVESTCGTLSNTCQNTSVGYKCNGVSATSQQVTHTYENAGSYTAKMIAEEGSAPPAQATTTITVNTTLVAPTLATGPATNVTSTNATLNGTVNPNGSSTQYKFLYGTSSNLSGALSTGTYAAGAGTTSVAAIANAPGLSANQKYYFQLQAWSSAGSTSGNVLSFTTPAAGTYLLSTSVVGSGTVTSTDGSLACNSGTCSHAYNSGTNVTLNASGASGWTFAGWSGACTGTGSCTVNMSGNEAVTANFTQSSATYLFSVSTTGQGTVTSSDGYITCGTVCNQYYSSGTSVTLTATPATGWTFIGWSGACVNVSGACTVTMNAAQKAVANFTQTGGGTYTLLVQISGIGTVTSQDGKINCSSSQCSAVYSSGSKVTLSELPAAGYAFSAWGEACTGQGACTFTVTNNMIVTASFTSSSPGYTELNTVVTGSGSISSTDGLVNCSSNCATSYPVGSSVILNAIPNPGNVFTGWTGACQGQGQCIIPLEYYTVVGATFSASSGNTVMVVSPGVISTIAGNGTQGSSGDEDTATQAALNMPTGVAVDNSGNIYIADFDANVIRAVNTQQTPIMIAGVTIPPGAIATIAGTGLAGFSGDGSSPTTAKLYAPAALHFDRQGNLYIVDADNYRIRVINLQTGPITIAGTTIQPGTIMTVAGDGSNGQSGDGGAAKNASLSRITDLAVDASGGIYIADFDRIRYVNSSGIISTFAGGGTGCSGQLNALGDGCSASQAQLGISVGLALDSLGNLFIGDQEEWGVRVVYKGGMIPGIPANPQSGYIYRVTGGGSGCSGQVDSSGDGCIASDSANMEVVGIAIDQAGSLYIAGADARIHRVDRASGVMTAIGGNGTAGYLEDGVPATSTEIALNSLEYGNPLAIDSQGNLIFADAVDYRVRNINATDAYVNLVSGNVGTTGAGVSIAIENIGTAAMNQPALAIGGADASDFGESDTCKSSIPAGGSCVATVQFSPTAQGTRYGTLTISAGNAQNSPETVQLIGNEANASGLLTLSTSSLSFGNEAVSNSTAAQQVTVSNTGTADILSPIVSVSGTNPGDFLVSNSCQTTIATGASCTVSAAFAPIQTGPRTANLVISGIGASNAPATVSLVGTGVAVSPSFGLTNGGPITVTAGSNGMTALTVMPAGGFAGQVNFTCGVSGSPAGLSCLAPAANVTGTLAATSTLTVGTAAATPAGNYTATVTATDAATGKITAQTVVIVTVSTAPSFALSASPTSVSVAQGNSGTTTITVTDVGGFSGDVMLAASGLPTGVTASFAAGSGAGIQVLTLTADASAAITSSPVMVTITGTSGALTATTSISLSVTAQPGFTAGTGGTTSITVSPGATTGNTGTVSVVGTNGFTGPVALQCKVTTAITNPHDKPGCSLSPDSVRISGASPQTSTLTVTTTAASSSENHLEKLFWPSTGGSALALVVLFIIPRRRRRWSAMLALLILILISVSGCGGGGGSGSGGGAKGVGGGSGDPGTTPGAYTITIAGTSGSASATVGTITLTVQ